MKAIEKLSARECITALEELRTRQREVVARLGAIEPAPEAQPAPAGVGHTGWTPPDPLAAAGPVYRDVVLNGTAEELAEIVQERQVLEAAAVQLGFRSDAIQERLKVARQEEAKRAAPAQAKALLEALPSDLDRIDAALLELAAARDTLDSKLRELDAARELAGGEPFYSPELLRRVWAADPRGMYSADLLRRHLSTRPDALPVTFRDPFSQVAVVEQRYRVDCLQKLEPAKPSLLERFMGSFREPADQLTEHRRAQAEKGARAAAADARARELAGAIGA